MKKLFLFTLLFAISTTLLAQNDVTQFMGIPVDGFKPEMIKKLKEKGFVSSEIDQNILEGEFNGTQVNVHIATTNNKVCRIMLCDANTMDETDIKIRFNTLCQQFENNSKYISNNDYKIADDEDISYEMIVHNKRYEALFYQKPLGYDSIMANLNNENTQYELEKPIEGNKQDSLDISAYLAKTKESLDYLTKINDLIERQVMKPVWFMISEYHGKYYIVMYYDNEYNRAHGDDL